MKTVFKIGIFVASELLSGCGWLMWLAAQAGSFSTGATTDATNNNLVTSTADNGCGSSG